jgi:hypothetical protein
LLLHDRFVSYAAEVDEQDYRPVGSPTRPVVEKLFHQLTKMLSLPLEFLLREASLPTTQGQIDSPLLLTAF